MRDDAQPYANAAVAPPPVTKSGKSAKASTSEPGKPAKLTAKSGPAPTFSELSDDEKAKRKQMGMLAMTWSIMIPALLQYFLFRTTMLWGLPWFALLTGPPVILYVTKKYWK